MINLLPEKQSIFLRASISGICNFSCQYCATDLGMENNTPPSLKAPLLNVEEYVRNMKMIAQHGFNAISFTGGEPLLNPEFPRILKECRNIFKTIEITTNGSKLLENIEVVKEFVDVLKISVDAYDSELSVKIARNPLAAKTSQIIEKCCEAGIKTIGFNFVYMKQNENELPKLVDFVGRLKQQYGTDIYISILDLYYSKGNRAFWQDQFVNLSELRSKIANEDKKVNRRLRIGCDSYNFIWNDVLVNMKDSISCTHRAKMCAKCPEYCQEGIYSLKHSASGWLSVCPSNNLKLGALLNSDIASQDAHVIIDGFVKTLNEITRIDNTGEEFFRFNNMEELYE